MGYSCLINKLKPKYIETIFGTINLTRTEGFARIRHIEETPTLPPPTPNV